MAPDNGLLTLLLDGTTVRSVERPELSRQGPGDTFHGRDRLAPIAAALAAGAGLAGLGPEIAPGWPVR